VTRSGRFQESIARSAIKAATWRITGTIVTVSVAFVVTRKGVVALTVGSVDFLLKLVLFWAHERAWNRIDFGKHEVRAPMNAHDVTTGDLTLAQKT
jgi:uncharacterized membrane protein